MSTSRWGRAARRDARGGDGDRCRRRGRRTRSRRRSAEAPLARFVQTLEAEAGPRMDGCFDLAHFGHANALRQAKACGDTLVVGLIPDAEVLRCKGPPVLREAERRAVIASVKWVDEIIENVPYDLTPAFCETLYSKHGVDFIVHGDDPCLLPDGTDAYDAQARGQVQDDQANRGSPRRTLSTASCAPPRPTSDDDDAAKDAARTPRRTPRGRRRKEAKTGSSPRRVASRSSAAVDVCLSRGRGWWRTARSTCSTPDTCVCCAKPKNGRLPAGGRPRRPTPRAGRGAAYPVLALPERALGVMACRHGRRHRGRARGGDPGPHRHVRRPGGGGRRRVGSRAERGKPRSRRRAGRFGGKHHPSRDEDSFAKKRARVIQKRDPNEIAKTLGVFREVPPPPRTKRAARTA